MFFLFCIYMTGRKSTNTTNNTNYKNVAKKKTSLRKAGPFNALQQ